MSGMDWFDGQFVAVTLAALWGGWILLRPLLRSRGERKAAGASCARCSAGSPCAKSTAGAAAGLVSLGSGSQRKVQSAE